MNTDFPSLYQKMETLTITGVPEHFNYPWRMVVDSQPFLDLGIRLQWKNEPKGSGAMNMALRNGSTDIAILLTESFVKDKISGNPGLIIGMHVTSPLTWGVHISGKDADSSIGGFRDPVFFISRHGSGSHLMAYILAEREQLDQKSLVFEVVGDLSGAIERMNSGQHGMFLWEKFTTKPYVENGTMRRIGEIATPWPCFVTVAHSRAIQKFGSIIQDLRDRVFSEAKKLQASMDTPAMISSDYGIDLEDVNNWMRQTEWAKDCRFKRETIENTQDILLRLGLIEEKKEARYFIAQGLVELAG